MIRSLVPLDHLDHAIVASLRCLILGAQTKLILVWASCALLSTRVVVAGLSREQQRPMSQRTPMLRSLMDYFATITQALVT